MEQQTKAIPQKGLNQRHIFFIALGSAIGTGLFYGSAKAIKLAGPSVLLAYMLAGLSVFIVMRALGEMILHKPLPGSFGGYASHYLGPLAGFITGWTYIIEMALVCLADITAFAIYMGIWFPEVSPWLWTLGITLIIVGINLLAVKIFGELEFWLSLIKVVAIIAMILGGMYIIFFGYTLHVNGQSIPHAATGISNLWSNGGFFPNGIEGFVASFAVVIFAFGGIEIIGLTAAEAKHPEKSIPRAINTVPSRIFLFYVGTIAVLMSLFPWNQIGDSSSPFVQIFNNLGISSAAHILNIVVITAAVSAINSDLFGAARMIYGLAHHRHAPNVFGQLSSRGAPIAPVLAMLVVLLIGVVLNVFFHDQLFFLIAAMATFATIWVWLMILLSHVSMRFGLSAQERAQIRFPMPFWPFAPFAAITFLIGILILLGLNADTIPALMSGLIWLGFLSVCYYVWVRKKEIPLTQLAEKQKKH